MWQWQLAFYKAVICHPELTGFGQINLIIANKPIFSVGDLH